MGSSGLLTTSYPNSVLASTTNNISGIFDMSGGAWEYVMGVMVDQNGNPMSGRNSIYNSGFKGVYSEGSNNTTGYDWPNEKYYEIYEYGTTYQFDRRILGDATGEMGPFASFASNTFNRTVFSWYSDGSSFFTTSSPWLMRGSHSLNGLEAGQFSIGGTEMAGDINSPVSFRLVLTPT